MSKSPLNIGQKQFTMRNQLKIDNSVLTSNESMKEFPQSTKNMIKNSSVESIGVSSKLKKYATASKTNSRAISKKNDT